jgi:hypothetical protein
VNALRLVLLTVLLTLILASGAYADGTYQRTDDRKKALVWNNDPQPGDAANWSGDRDADGYATGPGKLQWFRVERGFLTGSNIAGRRRTPISSYSGTMVHGKFEGGVMTVDHGKTYHATFADGHKKGRWITGPLVTKAERAETEAPAEKPETGRTATSPETASEIRRAERVPTEKAESRVAEESTSDIPAEGPAESEVSGQKTEVSKSTAVEKENVERPPIAEKAAKESSPEKTSQPLIAQASTEEPDQSSTPRAPVNRKAALEPGAVRAIERPTTHIVAKKPEAEKAVRAERAKTEDTDKPVKIAKPASSQPPKAEMPPSEDIPAEGPVAVGTDKTQSPVSKTAKAEPPATKETPTDSSIRTLTGPPSSLHVNAPPPETNPPMQISTPPIAAVSSPTSAPKLTSVQAMDIADIEAREKGYDLGDYQLPKAEYNAANDTWSVGYATRDGNKDTKKLSVTIQDKTGKAEVKK